MSIATLITLTRPSPPPSYSVSDERITVLVPPPAAAIDTLPAYSPSNRSTRSRLSVTRSRSAVSSNCPPKEFRTAIKLGKKGTSVAVLAVCGDGGLSKASPTLVEGQSLRGTVKLVLEKPEGFSKLVVCVSRSLSTSCCSPCYTLLEWCLFPIRGYTDIYYSCNVVGLPGH